MSLDLDNTRYWNGQMARYYYLRNQPLKCYGSLLKAELTWKNFGLFLTAWHEKLRKKVMKKYNILNTTPR